MVILSSLLVSLFCLDLFLHYFIIHHHQQLIMVVNDDEFIMNAFVFLVISFSFGFFGLLIFDCISLQYSLYIMTFLVGLSLEFFTIMMLIISRYNILTIFVF